MHYCYIIYSPSFDKYYVGESYDVHQRLVQHKQGFFKNAFTSKTSDWKLKLVISCDNRQHARSVEKFIKSMKSKKFTERLISSPEIVDDIKKKCWK